MLHDLQNFFCNSVLYIGYFIKIFKLSYLKRVHHLDYTGRYFSSTPELNGYEGCYPVKRVLKQLPITENDSIIDVGCGKGLFFYYAKKFPFKRIDGLEILPDLAQTATNNSLKLRDARIHVFNCDARCFNYDHYNFFFINNPFSKKLMADFANMLKESVRTSKRKIIVIYQFPFHKDVFTELGFKIFYEKRMNCILTFE